jgi:hypothetical protein
MSPVLRLPFILYSFLCISGSTVRDFIVYTTNYKTKYLQRGWIKQSEHFFEFGACKTRIGFDTIDGMQVSVE